MYNVDICKVSSVLFPNSNHPNWPSFIGYLSDAITVQVFIDFLTLTSLLTINSIVLRHSASRDCFQVIFLALVCAGGWVPRHDIYQPLQSSILHMHLAHKDQFCNSSLVMQRLHCASRASKNVSMKCCAELLTNHLQATPIVYKLHQLVMSVTCSHRTMPIYMMQWHKQGNCSTQHKTIATSHNSCYIHIQFIITNATVTTLAATRQFPACVMFLLSIH